MCRLWPLAFALTAACGDATSPPDAAEPDVADTIEHDTGGGGRALEPLESPAAGEWPTFKRDLAHSGLAPGKAAMTATSYCVKWTRPLTCDTTRGASGALIATIGGTPTVFFVVDGPPSDCADFKAGHAYALDGKRGGAILWDRPLPDGAQSDPYAPTLADIDEDGTRELVFASNNSGKVFALRTEPEADGDAGTIQWVFELPDAGARSEGAPIVANFDPRDARPEIALGSDYDGVEGARSSKVFLIDGAGPALDGRPFEAPSRGSLNDRCRGGNKIDSSSPSVAWIGDRLVLYVGAWNGSFYGLEWRADPEPGLYEQWRDALPASHEDCPIRKVRSGAALGQIVPGGDLEIAFGYMAEKPSPLDYQTSALRILSANGLGHIADVALNTWKSTPSLADLDPTRAGLELTGGRYRGFWAVRQGQGFEIAWDAPLGDGNGNWGGNRTSPAVADLDGDGDLEVVLGVEGGVSPELVVYDGRSGDVAWTFPLPGSGMDSSPAIGNIDDDADLEIVFLGRDGVAYALDSNPDATVGGGPCK